jgi:hypothetical protein
MKLLPGALLGGSVRTSRHKPSSNLSPAPSLSKSKTRTCSRSEATTYVGGSNTLIVGSQKYFTIGHALLGTRPRPANKK